MTIIMIMCRREALRRWKSNQWLGATYGNLLESFVQASHTQCAEAVCEVLRKKCKCSVCCVKNKIVLKKT